MECDTCPYRDSCELDPENEDDMVTCNACKDK